MKNYIFQKYQLYVLQNEINCYNIDKLKQLT